MYDNIFHCVHTFTDFARNPRDLATSKMPLEMGTTLRSYAMHSGTTPPGGKNKILSLMTNISMDRE